MKNATIANSQKLYTILGLDKAEIKVLNYLLTLQRVSDIVKNTVLPRSTIVDILYRLQKRKLIEKHNKFFLQNFETMNYLQKQELQIGEISKVRVIKGLQNILDSWNIVEHSKETRWYLYQTLSTAKYVLQEKYIRQVMKYNNAVGLNKQITELYIEPNWLANAQKHIEQHNRNLFLPWLKSIRRNFVCYEVPKDVFYSPNDIFIFHDSVFFTHYPSETCIEIKQYEIALTIKNLLHSLKYIGKQIDLSKIIEAEISKTK